MGSVFGGLLTVAALVVAFATFLPGAKHVAIDLVLATSCVVAAYGIGSLRGFVSPANASVTALAIGTALTIPVIGLGLYLTGGSLSYIEPLMVFPLLFTALFFPARWAWPLATELILVAGTPLIYDSQALENAYLPRYIALVVAYFAATLVMLRLKRSLVEAEARQREFANRDPLTGAGNRRMFDSALQGALTVRTDARGRRSSDDSPLSLLIIDLDDFKGINDNYGHQVGDTVLCGVAARIHAKLRSSDTLARIGGDEFAVIAPGAYGEATKRLAQAITKAVASAEIKANGGPPTASVGWAVYPQDGRDFETLMRVADDRMLRLKQGGDRLRPPVSS